MAQSAQRVRQTLLGPASFGVRLEVAALVDGRIWMAGAGAGSIRVISFDPQARRISAVLDIGGCSEVWGAAGRGTELFLVTGAPAELIMVDTVAAKVVERQRLPPGGPATEDGLTAWNVAVAPDGAILIGTAPDGGLWVRDPQHGELRRLATVGDHPSYLRTLAAADGAVFCGLGPRARLIRVDLADGATDDLTPDGWADLTFVRACALSGDWLIAGSTPQAHLVAVDLTGRRPSRTWAFPYGEPYVTAIHPVGRRVWVTTTRTNALWALDLPDDDHESAEPRLVTMTEHGASALGSLPDGRLWVMQDGLALIDPESGSVTEPSLDWSRTRRLDATRALCWADGRVYSAGESGLRVHSGHEDRDAVTIEAPDVECLAASAQGLILGGPPNAGLRRLPYGGTTVEPVTEAPGDQQRHVAALAEDAEPGQLIMGTRPDYGAMGGSLITVRPDTSTVTGTRRGLLHDQSVTAVAPCRDHGESATVIGGSIHNGEGTLSRRDSAQVALVGGTDLRWVVEPVREAATVTDLCVVGPRVVGVTDRGVAFGIELAAGVVLWTVQVARGGGRLCVLNDVVYGTDGDVVWALRCDSDRVPTAEVLAENLRAAWSGPPAVVTDGEAALFTVKGSRLLRLDLGPE